MDVDTGMYYTKNVHMPTCKYTHNVQAYKITKKRERKRTSSFTDK